MSPEGRERRTKMGFYYLFLEWGSARSACTPEVKEFKRGGTCGPRGKAAGTEGIPEYRCRYGHSRLHLRPLQVGRLHNPTRVLVSVPDYWACLICKKINNKNKQQEISLPSAQC